MALETQDLEDMMVGWQKVVDIGQYGRVIYVFQHSGNKITAVTNKSQGVGELILTIRARNGPYDGVFSDAFDKKGRSDPADYSVLYEGTGKLGS